MYIDQREYDISETRMIHFVDHRFLVFDSCQKTESNETIRNAIGSGKIEISLEKHTFSKFPTYTVVPFWTPLPPPRKTISLYELGQIVRLLNFDGGAHHVELLPGDFVITAPCPLAWRTQDWRLYVYGPRDPYIRVYDATMRFDPTKLRDAIMAGYPCKYLLILVRR